MSKTKVIILVVLGCFLLAIANVALWASINVFNPDRFGENVAKGLQTDASTQALSVVIVDKIAEEYPEFPPIAQKPAEEVVAWMLQRPVFAPVYKETAAIASSVMTTSAKDVIGIDFSNVIDQVLGVVSTIDEEAATALKDKVDLIKQSEPVVIYESGRFPKLRQMANTVPWLWPLAGIGAIALMAIAYSKASDQKSALNSVGIGVLITGALNLFLIPAIQAPVHNNIVNPAIQTVVGEILKALTQGLIIQCLLLIGLGILIIIMASKRPNSEVAVAEKSNQKAKSKKS